MVQEFVDAKAKHHRIWEASLAKIIADVFECQRIYDRANYIPRRCFIGTRSDVAMSVWLYKYLRLRIAKGGESKFSLQRDQKEFGRGAVEALKPRLHEMYMRKKEVQLATTTDIMVVGKELAVQGALKKAYPNITKTGFQFQGGSRSARVAGVAAGSAMSINQQVR